MMTTPFNAIWNRNAYIEWDNNFCYFITSALHLNSDENCQVSDYTENEVKHTQGNNSYYSQTKNRHHCIGNFWMALEFIRTKIVHKIWCWLALISVVSFSVLQHLLNKMWLNKLASSECHQNTNFQLARTDRLERCRIQFNSSVSLVTDHSDTVR